MSPSELAEYLSVLRDAGIRRGSWTLVDGDKRSRLDFEMAPGSPAPGGALVDRDGKPVNLDEGNPWTEDDRIYKANFDKRGG